MAAAAATAASASTSAASGGCPAGRVLVVTGGNKGIGFEIAKQLAATREFGRVILGCRSLERGTAAAAELAESGGLGDSVAFEAAELDVANASSVEHFATWLEGAEVGRLDALVNNAGVLVVHAPFRLDEARRTLDTNYRGLARLTEHLLPLLRAGDQPRLVNVASQLGALGCVPPTRGAAFSAADLTREQLDALVHEFETDVGAGTYAQQGWPTDGYGIYSVSKLAVIAFTKLAAREEVAAGSPVLVNCCCPGYCATDMTGGHGSYSAAEGAGNAVMLARLETAVNGAFIRHKREAEW